VSTYPKLCNRCRTTAKKKDRRKRKKCVNCKWIAISPPSLGRRSLGVFDTKELALKAERDALQARDQGFDLPTQTLTLSQVADKFFQDVKGRLAPATYARYEEHWKHHVEPALGGIVASKLKPAHIAELLAKLGSQPVVYVHKLATGEDRKKKRIGKPLGGTSLVRVHRFVHRMLRWAERMSLVGRNVANLIEAPRPNPSRARALTTDEAATLLALAKGSEYETFLLVALTTGCRRGELAALQWDCVDFRSGCIFVRQSFGEDRRGACFLKTPKSGRERVVPLSAAAFQALKALRGKQAAKELHAEPGTYEDKNFVFADEAGDPPDLDGLSKAFAKLARLAEIKGATLHSCRHFTATSALVEGSDLNSVSAVIGHGQASTTLNVYGHVVAGAKSAVIDRVGDALALAQARHAAGEKRSG
jgi:integrase